MTLTRTNRTGKAFYNEAAGLWCWLSSYKPLTQDECDDLGLDSRGYETCDDGDGFGPDFADRDSGRSFS